MSTPPASPFSSHAQCIGCVVEDVNFASRTRSVTTTVRSSVQYKELGSKLAWAIGDTLKSPYSRKTDPLRRWSYELASLILSSDCPVHTFGPG